MEFILSIIAKVLNFLVNRTLPAVIVLVIGILAIVVINRLLSVALQKSKLEKAAHSLIKSVVKVALFVLLGLIVCSKLGLDVTSVVALASVLTLAVSLALQNALSNLIGGFTLLYTKPFHSGDFVEIAGQSGTVQEIGLTYTKLATADNKIVSIPNGSVVAAQIVNFTTTGTRRVDITVSASYDIPVEKVLAALQEAGKVPTALDAPEPFVGVSRYGESAIEYVLRVWSTADDYWTTMFAANQKVKAVFDAQGILMTYPHLNVHLDK